MKDRMSGDSSRRRLSLHTRVRQSWFREFWEWARCKNITLPNVKQLGESIAELDPRGMAELDVENEIESPIFVLSTGLRSGSTLLQRILVTDPQLLLWGEPLGEITPLPEIVQMIVRISKYQGLKDRFAQETLSTSSMVTSWIALLYPPAEDFRLGLRQFFDRWLGEPARQRGFPRWGFKEVRLGATEASLLHWLYPRGKFVILSRNPYDCYRSLSDSGWHHVYYSRPHVRVDSAAGFARHWNRLACSWSELPPGFPAIHIRYEDIVQGRVDFRRLESWLGLKLQEQLALSVFVGNTTVRERLSWHERLIISHEASAGMCALGYSRRSRNTEDSEQHGGERSLGQTAVGQNAP